MLNKLIPGLQIGGFVIALVGCFPTLFSVHYRFFLLGFAVHVVGDILLLREKGLP